MRPLTKTLVLAFLLTTTTHAQSSSDTDSPSLTCDDLSASLAHNASVVHNTTALAFLWLGGDGDLIIREDDRTTWQISSYIGPVYDRGYAPEHDENDTQAILWLDTGDSDMERLGRRMGFVHNYIPLRNRTNGNLSWSREVLEKSQEDSGDCETMLGEGCVQVLQSWYSNQGTNVWLSGGDYTIEHTIPSECEGMFSVATTLDTLPLNASTEYRIWQLNPSVNLTSTEHFTAPTCDDRNLSSSWGTRVPNYTDYDMALNFPVVDVLTFYPIAPIPQSFSAYTAQARVVCLKPENVQDGSRAPRSAKEMLDDLYGSQDDDDDEEEESSAKRAFGWDGSYALTWAVGMVVGVWLAL